MKGFGIGTFCCAAANLALATRAASASASNRRNANSPPTLRANTADAKEQAYHAGFMSTLHAWENGVIAWAAALRVAVVDAHRVRPYQHLASIAGATEPVEQAASWFARRAGRARHHRCASNAE